MVAIYGSVCLIVFWVWGMGDAETPQSVMMVDFTFSF
jgi:hypothetical protein